MRAILAQVLQDQGYEVTAVDRGEKAVESARRNPFDLIVADIRMEGMNGLEAVARTKQAQPEIGTVIVSGYASPEETDRARQLNVGGYLKKPFKMKEFLDLVRSQLVDRTKHQERQRRGLSARDSLLWAFDALAETYGCERPVVTPAQLQRAGDLAARLAEQMGTSGEVTEEVRAAATLALISEQVQPPADFLNDLSLLPTLKSSLLHRQDRFDADPPPPLESRILALACQVATSPEPLDHKALLENDPGRFDPEVVQAFRHVEEGSPAPAATGGTARTRKGKNLLSVARALEQVGQVSSAFDAYKEAAASASGTREEIVALMGQSRLTENEEISRKLILEAAEKSRLLGPVNSATTTLEAGLLLYRQGDERARPLLRKAVSALERLGFEGQMVKAAVPLLRLGEQLPDDRWARLFSAIVSPRYAEEINEAADWLLVDMLEVLAEHNLEQLHPQVARLTGLYAFPLTQGLSKGKLSVAARNYLLDAVGSGNGAPPAELVEQLQRDSDEGVRVRADKLKSRGGAESAAPPMLRVHSFGLFEVRRGSEPVPDGRWKTQKTKHFFAYLAAQWGKYIHEEQIMENFWPDDREKGKKNIYWATSVTRRCLRGEDGDQEILERKGENLRLNPDVPHWHDLQEFEEAYSAGVNAQNAGDTELARSSFRRLQQLYGGPYMEGCYLDWAVRRRDACEKQVVEGMCLLAELAYGAGDYQEALEAGNRALEIDPCRQSAHLVAMRAYIELSQPEAAIAQYQKCEQILRKEFQIEPNTELIEVFYRARLGMPGSG